MTNATINKFSFQISALQALPKDQLSTFLLLGLFLNEANWLQKLVLISTNEHAKSEPEEKGQFALSIMLAKLVAAKMHQGWCAMQGKSFMAALNGLPESKQAEQLKQVLAPMLAKDSLIHKIRNSHGSHYPNELSLTTLMAHLQHLDQSDVAIYGTEHSCDTISFISELSAASEMIAITGKATFSEALKTVLDEIIKAAGIYCELLHVNLTAVSNVIGPAVNREVFNNDEAIAIDSIHIPFFVSPPNLSRV